MIGIYKITSPNKRVYIGQSINIEKRIIRYRNLHCQGQPKIYRSIKKYGWNSHNFEILLECEASELNNKERYFQDLFNTIENGLNCTLTMENGKSGTQSKDTIEKRRIGMLGKHNGNKNPMFGKKIKESSKQLQRDKLSGELNYLSKIILNTETGIFYYGLNEASKSIDMVKGTLWANLKKYKTNTTSFIYV